MDYKAHVVDAVEIGPERHPTASQQSCRGHRWLVREKCAERIAIGITWLLLDVLEWCRVAAHAAQPEAVAVRQVCPDELGYAI